MIACFAWTNLQIINISNAKVNLYADEQADLYIRMGEHISEDLVAAVRESGIYEHVYTFSPVVLSYKNMRFGWIPGFKVLLLKGAFRKEYDAMLDQICPSKQYSRALVTWFYAENAFVLDYWRRHTNHLAITLVEEGTGSYCYGKKDLYFPMFMGKFLKDRIRRNLTERPLAKRLSGNIDTFCLYKPAYCRPDIDYEKLELPLVRKQTNPVIYKLLKAATNEMDEAKLKQYNEGQFIYFSLFSQEGAPFDATSNSILNTIVEENDGQKVIVKVHTGDPIHAENFAKEFENHIFVDREVYIFEGLYAGLKEPNEKVMVSCASTAAINPKFMFGDEPYVIFTYKLYDTYRRFGVERDDWISSKLIDAYDDKSKVMIPDTVDELKQIIRKIQNK